MASQGRRTNVGSGGECMYAEKEYDRAVHGARGHREDEEMEDTSTSSSVSDGLSARALSIGSPGTSSAISSPERHACTAPVVAFKLCVECEDQSAEVTCLDCEEEFCRPCFQSQHRRGKRSEHRVQAILGEVMAAPEVPMASTGVNGEGEEHTDIRVDDDGDAVVVAVLKEASDSGGLPTAAEEYEELLKKATDAYDDDYHRNFLERSKVTPMRLTEDERRLLGVLTSALNVSEYTDNVDTVSRRPKSQRIVDELEKLFSSFLGLMICCDPARGHALASKSVTANAEFFQDMFEIGRRYKILNPNKMRSTYGKLMHMLQDTQNRAIQQQLGFSCVKDVVTVYRYLEERDALDLLEDARVLIAHRDITDGGGKRNRGQVQADVLMKRMAAKELRERHASDHLSADDIQRVLDSLSDFANHANANVQPVRRMLRHLTSHFDIDNIEHGFSLAIGGGGRGSRITSKGFSMYGSGYGSSYFRTDTAKLSHDHSTHFTYVRQSLMLWKHIMAKMISLWDKADQDLLSLAAQYQLLNTGQGLNRVQCCPKVAAEMRSILDSVQRECGPWVGLSVVHLGDRDVPNALVFIDKYTQVPRILAPLARVIDQCSGLFDNEVLRHYAESVWESPENLKMHILVDFFRHAFDGDGDDGGSCIDGRLTSAWNWCEKIGKKPYRFALYLSGFQGFDGRFD